MGPLKWLQVLETAGAGIEKMGDGMVLVSMRKKVEHQAARDTFTKLLSDDGSVDVDPYVIPHFGVPVFVHPVMQLEVYNILATYQPLLRNAFLPGAPPIIIQNINHHPNGYQFHHAQIALAKVRERLQNPGPQCPLMDAVPAGGFICDLELIYANGIVVEEGMWKRH